MLSTIIELRMVHIVLKIHSLIVQKSNYVFDHKIRTLATKNIKHCLLVIDILIIKDFPS